MRKHIIFVLIVCILSFSITACSFPSSGDSMEKNYYDLAQQYIEQQNYDTALRVVQEGLIKYPNSDALLSLRVEIENRESVTEEDTTTEESASATENVTSYEFKTTETTLTVPAVIPPATTSAARVIAPATSAHYANPNNIVYPHDVIASAYQPDGNYNRTYSAKCAFDRDYDTCWMVSGEQNAVGSWIELRFDAPQQISGIQLLNGNCWDGYYQGEKVAKELYTANGRVRDFTLTFSDGTSCAFTAKDIREEYYGENRFYFDTIITTSSIRLTINSGYTGSKWKTVCCISEIAAFY